MNYAERFQQLINDPSTSYALQYAIRAFDRRDALHAFCDAETLAELFGLRFNELTEPARRRMADRIDGYDRDDLGESPDF